MKWSYGVTTIPSRRKELLPKTLASLARAGFPTPRLFIDGESDPDNYLQFSGLAKTFRSKTIRTYGNWVLGLWELFIREPHSDRYAMFQDDLVMGCGAKEYLASTELEEKTYWNLYTAPANQELALREAADGSPAPDLLGFYPSNQLGKGALALVFSRDGVLDLLSSRETIERPATLVPEHSQPCPCKECKGWRNLDGAIVHALTKLGYREMVHNPSLVQHTGLETTMDWVGKRLHPISQCFWGEKFDLRKLQVIGKDT